MTTNTKANMATATISILATVFLIGLSLSFSIVAYYLTCGGTENV
jgi:hypothetical protein